LVGGITENIFSVNVSHDDSIGTLVADKRRKSEHGEHTNPVNTRAMNEVHIFTSDHESYANTIDFTPATIAFKRRSQR